MPASPVSSSLEEEGRRLVEGLQGRWSGRGGLCRCPAHEDRTPSLSVRVGRRSLLLHCFAGCDTVRVLGALRARGLAVTGARAGSPDPPAVLPGRGGHRAAAERLWRAARSAAGTPADRYLAARGLRAGSPELRYHPRAPMGARPFTSCRPAMVAAVRDEGGVVAVHRTFLAPGGAGLAAIAAPRMGLGRFGSGAVRLGGSAPRLGLAEGIETALSASALFDLPCWATLGTERFARVALPAGVAELVLFLDADRGGRRAEALARRAFGHLPIEARYPPSAGDDWNDVLRARSGRAAV